MKLEPVTKFDKKKKTSKIYDNVMSENRDVIVVFPIYFGQFGTIRKPDSGCIVCKTYIFIKSNLFMKSNLLFYKN